MKLKQRPEIIWYLKLYNFVASERLKQNDIDQRKIHTQLVTVLSTGILMWLYAFLAWFTMSTPVPGIVGFICSSIHLLSPLLFKFTNSIYFISNVLLAAGIVHQSTFAFHSGGFMSVILIWFGILPMLAGVMSGRKGTITWVAITISVSVIFLFLHLFGFNFPYSISHRGMLWAQVFLVFGWIFLSSVMIIVYTELREHTEYKLYQQGHKIDDLFRVLFHDLANPLGRIAIGLTIAKKQLPNGESNRGLEIATLAADSMMEITQNIRRMYAMSKGKANVDLHYCPFNKTIEYIRKIYNAELEKKHVTIEYNDDKNAGLQLLVEPVSFNNQVIGNIISNAIKFSPENGHIVVTAYPSGEETVTIEIKDHGIGIPQSLLLQLFDLSKKTTRSGTMGEMGTGFGMHIMKSFVEMYGGQVGVESSEGTNGTPSGTTIRLILRGRWS